MIVFVIRIRSKYTGEPIWLGSKYHTAEDAERAIAETVCTRCNYADIIPISDDREWVSKEEGFVMQPTGGRNDARHE